MCSECNKAKFSLFDLYIHPLQLLVTLSFFLQTKEILKDCMALLLKAFPYFAEEIPCSCPQHLCSQNTLLKLCVDVSQSYIDISIKQFDGFVCRSRRQVCYDLVFSLSHT